MRVGKIIIKGGRFMVFQVLAINSGSTSTKVAWFHDDEEQWRETVRHDPDELAHFEAIADQFEFRLATIERAAFSHGSSFDKLSAVVGRGGLVDPIPGGTFAVDDTLLKRLRVGKPWEHASNLGGIIADAIARPRHIPAFIVDPVAVDEMNDIARITGFPELPKVSLAHALNIKATVRRAAKDLGREWNKLNVVVAHIGGGSTVCAHCQGRMVDLNSGNDFGPFSPERAGGLPAGDLARLCFSGKYSEKDLLRRLVGNGGMKAYLGTSDVREVKKRIESGDEEAKLVYEAMAYHFSKEIAAQAIAMSGDVDAILITGGVAYDSDFVALLQTRIQWIAPVLVYPGEDEMKALAEGALRVLRGEEQAQNYEQRVAGGGGRHDA